MACRGCWECLLKLLNFILSLTGLAIVGYGIYLFVEFSKASNDDTPEISPVSDDSALLQLGRPIIMAVSLSNSFFDNLPRAWYVCLLLSSCYFFGQIPLFMFVLDSIKLLFFVILCCLNLLSVI